MKLHPINRFCISPILIFCVMLCGVQFSHAQKTIKAYVQEKAVPIKTISPDSLDYSDLEMIGNSIGDARVVMLGEQDHGDAPTFLAKTRLIKYLHEKKGFNVLAFESDFFGLNEGFVKQEKTAAVMAPFLRKNIFPIWTYCNTCTDLFNAYIPNSYATASPLLVTGFDNQMILAYSSSNLMRQLDSVLKVLQLPITQATNYATEVLPTIDSMRRWYFRAPTDTSAFTKSWNYLVVIKEQAAQKLEPQDFWMMVIENLIQENLSYRSSQMDYRAARNTRDAQMALNLQWLLQYRYPNEKFIVWAANYHIAKYEDTVSAMPNKRLITMGSFFTRDSLLRKQTYVLGFTSYSGEAGRLGFKKYKVTTPRPNGFETWINADYNYAFVDFNQYKSNPSMKNEDFFLKGFGHSSFKTHWLHIFEGVFYIKRMYACEQ